MRPSSLGLAGALALLAGCGTALRLPDGGVANLPQQLVLALQAHDATLGPGLLAADATLIQASGPVTGRAAVWGALQGLSPGTAAPEGHHEVARLTLPDGRLLFALASGGAVTTVALFPRAATGVHGARLQQYQDAWNQLDATARRALLDQAWAPAGRYLDPGNDVSGVAGLDGAIAAFQQAFPGATLTAPPEVVALPGGWVVADWVLEAPSSPPLHGFDVGHLTDAGQIELITGFFTPR